MEGFSKKGDDMLKEGFVKLLYDPINEITKTRTPSPMTCIFEGVEREFYPMKDGLSTVITVPLRIASMQLGSECPKWKLLEPKELVIEAYIAFGVREPRVIKSVTIEGIKRIALEQKLAIKKQAERNAREAVEKAKLEEKAANLALNELKEAEAEITRLDKERVYNKQVQIEAKAKTAAEAERKEIEAIGSDNPPTKAEVLGASVAAAAALVDQVEVEQEQAEAETKEVEQFFESDDDVTAE